MNFTEDLAEEAGDVAGYAVRLKIQLVRILERWSVTSKEMYTAE